MKSRNMGLRIVEILVLGGLIFAAVAPLFSSEEEKRSCNVVALQRFNQGSNDGKNLFCGEL